MTIEFMRGLLSKDEKVTGAVYDIKTSTWTL